MYPSQVCKKGSISSNPVNKILLTVAMAFCSIAPPIPMTAIRRIVISALLAGYYKTIPDSVVDDVERELRVAPITNKLVLCILRTIMLRVIFGGDKSVGKRTWTPYGVVEHLSEAWVYGRQRLIHADASVVLAVISYHQESDPT